MNIRSNYTCILFKKIKATTPENCMAMSGTPLLTPRIQPASKKRQLPSPEELNLVKKNKTNLSSVSEFDFGTFNIETPGAELPIHSSEMNSEELLDMDSQVSDSQSLLSQGVISLKDTDLEKIGALLRDTFQPEVKDSISSVIKSQVSDLVGSIVHGVLDGLKAAISSLEHENAELKKRVSQLEATADAAEQYSRRNSLRIAGIPESLGEDTDEQVLDLARDIDVDISISDIDRSHRVGKPRTDKPRDIIVKFATYRARRKMHKARATTKDRGRKGVFLNEDLTRARSRLLFNARNLVKSHRIRSAWSSDGTILIRDNDDRVHRILTENDISEFNNPKPQSRKSLPSQSYALAVST